MSKRLPQPPEGLLSLPMTEPAFRLRPLKPSSGRGWPGRILLLDVQASQGPSKLEMTVAAGQLWVGGWTGHTASYEPTGEPILVDTPTDLWARVDAATRRKGETRVLMFDSTVGVGVTYALRHLMEMGYTGEPGKDIAWGSGSVWLALRRGERAQLKIVDAGGLMGNVTPRSLGAMVADRPMPDDQAERAVWTVEVLGRGMFEHFVPYLIEQGTNLRRFSGPSVGHAIYRTRFMPPEHHQLPVHHNYRPLLDDEEAAAHGGRREAWRHGTIPGPIEEWDYSHAHAHIALERLPVAPESSAWYDPVAAERGEYIFLHRVLVRTEVPCLPYQHPVQGRVFPVGRFPVVCWGNELAMALEAGAEVIEHRGRWAYRAEPALAEWGEWLLGELADQTDPLIQACLKQWSHTTIGRFGMKRSKYVETDEVSWNQAAVDHFGAGGIAWSKVHGGPHDQFLYWQTGPGEGRVFGVDPDAEYPESSVPSIMSYTMSRTRENIWRAMTVAGLDQIVHVNGDGLLTTKRGGDRLRRKRIPGLRRKATYREGVRIYGANGWVALGEPTRRVAGLKATAVEAEPGVYEQLLTEQLRPGLGGEGVVRALRRFAVSDQPCGRKRQSDGGTRPYRVR
jgi:hypothetical protein